MLLQSCGCVCSSGAVSPQPDLVGVVHKGRIVVCVPQAQLVLVFVPCRVHPPAPRDKHYVHAPPDPCKRVCKQRREHQSPLLFITRLIKKSYLPPPSPHRTSRPFNCLRYLTLDLEGVTGSSAGVDGGADVDGEGTLRGTITLSTPRPRTLLAPQ